MVIGTQLGPYTIIAKLGEGGMGEVYRARDTKLGRDVAIKVLLDHSPADADRRARFDREARLLASLNHPHIASIYGAEDTPDGVRALVLELVEGPTLADRIANGPLAPKDALPIASQICDALDAAHERGIVHRDLKPANIKITADGQVKVLDFGLAKLATSETDEIIESNLTTSPTVTGTRMGILLGTAAYMSPEQARGFPVDKRTDIWAFGCVLYEMLTGRMAFRGETATDILATILERDVEMSALPDATPSSIRRLLRRCLEKDRKSRLRDIADARIELDEAASSHATAKVVRERRGWAMAKIGALAVAVALVSAVAAWNLKTAPASKSSSSPGVTRLVLAPTEQLTASSNPLGSPCTMADCGQRTIALSPDGRRVVYAAIGGGRQQLYVRDIDRFESAPIAGTDGAVGPTFSPDGRSIAFISDRKLKKVVLDGGTPQVLADFVEGSGLNWGIDDAILFNPGLAAGIWRVPSIGGTPTSVTRMSGKELHHRYPELLPTGKALLFSGLSGVADDQIYVQSFDDGRPRPLTKGVSPHYLAAGYLTYVQAGTLFAVPFDLSGLEMRGTPTAVLQGIRLVAGMPQVAFSTVGSMIYLSATGQSFESSLVWVDQAGNEQPTGATGRPFAQPRLAPDGRRVAVALRSGTLDLWSFDLLRETWARLTYDASSSFPIWNPDGARLTYGSTKDGATAIFEKAIGATESEQELVRSSNANVPLTWSPDGRTLAYVSVEALTGQDIWTFAPNSAEKTRPFLQTRFREGAPQFSPDGRWIAYVSDESGRNEIYARPFPGPGDKWTISADGGNEAVWARSKQIFYRNGTAMMVVDVTTSPSFSVGKPRRLFEKTYEPSGAFWPNYDVTPDGRRLLMIKSADTTPPPTGINVVLNWLDELKARVPSNLP